LCGASPEGSKKESHEKILAAKLTFALASLFAFGQVQAPPSQVLTSVY